MKTIIGPFHPDLEEALVREVVACKGPDLLAPLLILVPSDLLRRRLKILLTREQNLPLLNVQVLTFFQLAARLNEESGAGDVTLREDLFLEEALRQIIRTRQPGAESFAGIETRAGGCAALWQTLRDLRDGMVDPAIALQALQEGHFRRAAGDRLTQLLALFRTFQNFCRARNFLSQSDLDRRAAEQAGASRFLRSFAQIFYYGFYDLTQIQLDFFLAVARAQDITLLFPLRKSQPVTEAWQFAERFYESYLQGRSFEAPAVLGQTKLPASARLFDTAAERDYAEFPDRWQCRIFSSFGVYDEAAAAAKEILRLKEDNIGFHEIGVVARSLENYGRVVGEVFARHRIPLAGTFETPLTEFPLAKTVILLLNLPVKDFMRNQVIDFLSSPYVQFDRIIGRHVTPRPELWDLATRELAISRGAAEWRRLRRYTRRALVFGPGSDDDQPRQIRVSTAQLTLLADIIDTLIGDLANLPARASWHAFAEAWKMLLARYLGIDAESEAVDDGSPAHVIMRILDDLGALDAIDDSVALDDFSRTFSHWLERSSVSEDLRNRDGVMLLSATAARGLAFRALFVLGMNEGVFPRSIREDAFLRDGDREVLDRDLGHKVDAKLNGFAEEKLLFSLLLDAASERFYCSYQRADENGRVLAPSWYLNELRRALRDGGKETPILDIPRSLIEKASVAPFDREDLLLPDELAVRLTLQGDDPAPLVAATETLPDLYLQGREAIAEVDRSGARLHAFDGILSSFDAHWVRLAEHGAAPTALESYARCPFQFFARHVLKLNPLEWPEESLGPSPLEFGDLGHKILDRFYSDLIERRVFAPGASPIDVDAVLPAIAQRAFAEYEEKNPVGYPLFWETFKDNMVQTLRLSIAQDLAELKQSGFAPVSVESNSTARLPRDWPAPLQDFPIHGRMDRLDRNGARLRVIDYKFKVGANPKTSDKNLVTAALRGVHLQPPLYLILADQWARDQQMPFVPAEIAAAFYYIAARWPDGPLVAVSYGSQQLDEPVQSETKETIAYLAEGVRRGRFFINPGAQCDYCDVRRICRKNHPPSLWRAENDPLTEAHRALREKDPKKL